MTQTMSGQPKHVLVIERDKGPAMTLNVLLRQSGVEMTLARTTGDARLLMQAGWPTGIVIQGQSVERLEDNPSIENTLQFLHDLELAGYIGRVYVLSNTDFNNPAFGLAAPRIVPTVYNKLLVLTGEQPLQF